MNADDLAITMVYLDDCEPSSFSFYFHVPSRSAEIPDGLYVDYVDFQVEEAGWMY